TDDYFRLEYIVSVSDLLHADGRALTLNLAKNPNSTRADVGAADPGPKWPTADRDVLGAHALCRLQGRGGIPLVVARVPGLSEPTPGEYTATLTVALKGAPSRSCSTTLTVTVPESSAARLASNAALEMALRSPGNADLAQLEALNHRLQRQLESERRAWADQQ